MPQANSTTSMPRVTSPWASVKTLPCSVVIIRARVSRCSFSSARNLNRIRARRSGGVADQAGNARAADCTAASTSAALARATLPITEPVAGLVTDCERLEVPGVRRP
ncbi:hypothetical protein D3C76_1216760 [compost metagenome]